MNRTKLFEVYKITNGFMVETADHAMSFQFDARNDQRAAMYSYMIKISGETGFRVIDEKTYAKKVANNV